MNKLGFKIKFNEFSKENYSVLTIDNWEIGEIIASETNVDWHSELVPTLLHWLSNISERTIVWQKILPSEGEVVNAPVLMCPEDIDLWCDLVIARVSKVNNQIIWHDLGLDLQENKSEIRSPDSDPNFEGLLGIGYKVNWLKFKPYTFDLNNYIEVLNHFINKDYLKGKL